MHYQIVVKFTRTHTNDNDDDDDDRAADDKPAALLKRTQKVFHLR